MTETRFERLAKLYKDGNGSVKTELESFFIFFIENHHVGGPGLDNLKSDDLIRDLFHEVETSNKIDYWYYRSFVDGRVLYYLCINDANNRGDDLKSKFFGL